MIRLNLLGAFLEHGHKILISENHAFGFLSYRIARAVARRIPKLKEFLVHFCREHLKSAHLLSPVRGMQMIHSGLSLKLIVISRQRAFQSWMVK